MSHCELYEFNERQHENEIKLFAGDPQKNFLLRELVHNE